MKRGPELFHDGMRRLQDEFGTRRIADRIADIRLFARRPSARSGRAISPG